MKRVVLVSLGLILVAGYVGSGCLPADSGGVVTTGKGGAGGEQGNAGTTGAAGDTSTAGTTGQGGDTSGDAGTTGMAGSTPTAGTTGSGGNAGTTGGGGNAGTTGMAGRGGTTGTGGMSGTTGTAGRGGTTGVAGTTGTAGRGGTTGTAGTTGAAGRGGTTGTGGAGGDPTAAVGGPLDGKMLLGPCLRDTQAAVCATVSGTCPGANASDPALSGGLTTNATITLGGDPNTSYTIVLHVQGEVESKNYNGGTDVNATGSSPTLNGWRYPAGTTNPTPSSNNAYNVYMLRVVNPGATRQDYMLNSLDGPGTENHTTYGMDYTTPAAGQAGALVVKGTAKITLVAADSNCSMIKNCGPTQNDGNTCAAPIILQNIESTAKTLNPSFNFTTAYNGQWIVLTVKSVTPM